VEDETNYRKIYCKKFDGHVGKTRLEYGAVHNKSSKLQMTIAKIVLTIDIRGKTALLAYKFPSNTFMQNYPALSRMRCQLQLHTTPYA
jgi:hypothetical protein